MEKNLAVQAVITDIDQDLAACLRRNGDIESVRAFLRYCELRGFPSPDEDCGGWGCLCQVVANFAGADGPAIGVRSYLGDEEADFGVGIYVISEWEIVECIGHRESPTKRQGRGLLETLLAIDAAQPSGQRLGAELLISKANPDA